MEPLRAPRPSATPAPLAPRPVRAIVRRFPGRLRRLAGRRWVRRTAAAVGILLLLAYAVAFLIDEPLRRHMERTLNERLTGYTVRVGVLDFHPIGLSLDLEDVVVVQEAHPDPPVARIEELSASVQWRQLLLGRLVANFSVKRPVLHVDRAHFEKEASDDVPVEKRGWQDALQAIYPLKINEFKVVDGALTYVDSDRFPPLRLSAVEGVARNIRNIRSKAREYPSDLRVQAVVFDRGRLVVDGHADFLAAPHAGVNLAVTLSDIDVAPLKPIAARYNVRIEGGTVDARGRVEYAPTIKVAHLQQVTVRDARLDYVFAPRTAAARKAERAAEKVAEVAKEKSNDPETFVKVDELVVTRSSFGVVNRDRQPGYRAFLADTHLEVRNFSNHREEGTMTARLTGRFMGSGATVATATFRPEVRGPDFDLAVRIRNTDMRAMNDLLRSHGKIDVAGGTFSFFSELTIKNGRIDGYVKPLFRDVDVYDPAQDEDKGALRKLFERVVEGISKLLENIPRDEVATKATITGPVENPRASNLEIILRLVQNAFFKAILPGLEREGGRRR